MWLRNSLSILGNQENIKLIRCCESYLKYLKPTFRTSFWMG
nr:MAG TPA: hypothetical protein [Caudoviricetes sp.]